MAEYINREAAIKVIKELESATSFDFNEGLIAAMNVIDETQSEDVQPVVNGEWKPKILFDGFGDYPIFVCSECGNESSRKWNFCRECGAKMEGVKE